MVKTHSAAWGDTLSGAPATFGTVFWILATLPATGLGAYFALRHGWLVHRQRQAPVIEVARVTTPDYVDVVVSIRHGALERERLREERFAADEAGWMRAAEFAVEMEEELAEARGLIAERMDEVRHQRLLLTESETMRRAEEAEAERLETARRSGETEALGAWLDGQLDAGPRRIGTGS